MHLSIGYVYAHVYVGEQYPLIVHQWDMWHGSKNLGKKITAVRKTLLRICILKISKLK